MKLNQEKTQELMNDKEFVEKLNIAINDKNKFINLFQERGVELSSEEFDEIVKAKEKMSQLPEEKLKKISGGLDIHLHSHYGFGNSYGLGVVPSTAAEGVIVGGLMTIIGAVLLVASLAHGAKHGYGSHV